MITRRPIVVDRQTKSYLQSTGNARPSTMDVRAAKQFSQFSRDAEAAKVGGFNSAAAAFDPNKYGSAASRQFPGAFGPEPARARGNNIAPAMPKKAETTPSPSTALAAPSLPTAAAAPIAQPLEPTPVPPIPRRKPKPVFEF